MNYTQTVKENEAMYTKRDIKRVRDVSDIQQYLFWPKNSTVTGYINEKHINNCHLTEEDIHARQHVYGTPIPLLRGAMMRKHPKTHNRSNLVTLSKTVIDRYLKIHMFMDIFS